MPERECHDGFVHALARVIAEPDLSSEELGRCALVLELLVDSGAVDVEQADLLLSPRLVGPVG